MVDSAAAEVKVKSERRVILPMERDRQRGSRCQENCLNKDITRAIHSSGKEGNNYCHSPLCRLGIMRVR